jgi:RNA methyltransferase, TrmH family
VRPSTPPDPGGRSLGVFTEPISSAQNALVKRASSLRVRKFREREHAFLVEGADLVTAGMAAGLRPQLVFVRRGSAAHEAAAADGRLADVAVYVVTDRVAAKISTLEAPPDVLAVFPLPAPPPLYELTGPGGGAASTPGAEAARGTGAAGAAAGALVVYADRVADPGNMGTLVRAAAAFGAAALAASPGSVDLYAPKVVRAGMGAAFALPLYPEIALDELVARTGIADVYGLVAHDGDDLATAELKRPAVLCVGAERAGLSPESLGAVTQRLTIGLAPEAAGTVESLNAGVAGAVALYEFSRKG